MIPEDPQSNPPDAGHNIARKRTFTNELRGLINKIEEHESASGSPFAEFDDESLQMLTVEKLSRKLHELYYRTQMIGDYRQSRLDFNPFFRMKDGVFLRRDLLSKELGRLVAKIGFNLFLILHYDAKTKCYTRCCGNIDPTAGNDFIIGLKHPLYEKIRRAGEGMYIMIEELLQDPFYGRIIDRAPYSETTAIYSVAADSVIREALGEFLQSEDLPVERFLPPPILLLFNTGGGGNPAIRDCFQLIQEYCALPLWLISIPEDYGFAGYTAIQGCIDIISMEGKGGCTVIGSDDERIEGMYVMRFLAEKFRRILTAGSMMMQVRPRRLVIFSTASSISIIESTFHPLNQVCDGMFFMKSYETGPGTNSQEITAKILLAL